MVAKTQNPSEAASVASALGPNIWVIALIESALGLAQARDIALARGVKRLAFGSLDFAVDLGCAHIRRSLLSARSGLVMASRLAGLTGPIDGVTTSIDNMQAVEDDAAFAAALGFSGQALHPSEASGRGKKVLRADRR